MADSQLNEPERLLQRLFRKWRYFNGLPLFLGVLGAFAPIDRLPDRRQLPSRTMPLTFLPVALPQAAGPFRVAGAWVLTANDPRFGGLSALAIHQGRFLALSDLGAVARFDPPSGTNPRLRIFGLEEGPGPPGRKTSRDAEALAKAPDGEGWWVAYEQDHSLWLYDPGFRKVRSRLLLRRPDWWRNRGIEGLTLTGGELLGFAENGGEVVRVGNGRMEWLGLSGGMDVADSALAPDGSLWALTRSKGWTGIAQSVAKVIRSGAGYRLGGQWALPKLAFDNFEGMTIAARPGGGWRFWLVSDDGHRFGARTLLVALDLVPAPNANARRNSPGAVEPNSAGR